MAREMPVDLIDKIGAAADAHDASATAAADVKAKQDAARQAIAAVNDSVSIAANLKTAATNSQSVAVKALTDWLANEAVVAPAEPTPPPA